MPAVEPRPSSAAVGGGAAFGAAFFAWIAGARILDPTQIEWLMKGDWVPHHFGWHFFRVEPWHWPPGTITGYYAPLGTSIGLTDSIPLAAYALKPIGQWLPGEFQYLGLWLLLCFTLQGALAARLVGRWVASPWVQFCGGALCVLLPPLLARVGHAALCSHWLILWALLVVSRPAADRFRPVGWAALCLAAGMVQPYLSAMVLALLAAATMGGHDVTAVRRAAAAAAAVGATVLGWWLSGMFILSGESSLTEGGLGYYSMNLLALVAPMGWSAVLPELPVAGPGQEAEGFHYLGAGVLALLAVAATTAMIARRQPPAAETRLWSPVLVAAGVAMALFAVSPTVTVGSRVLVDLNGPWSAPLSVFRSSGRFAWPLAYLLVVAAVVTVARRLPLRAGQVVLAAAVIVQLVDLHGAHEARRRVARDPAFHSGDRRFTSGRWSAIAPRYRHIELVPPPQCGETPIPYEPAVRLAATYGLTVNAGVVARRDLVAQRRYCREADAEIDAVRLRDDTLYVVSPAAADVLGRVGGDRVACGALDSVWICTTAGAHAGWAAQARFD
jgi:hypothetical protein